MKRFSLAIATAFLLVALSGCAAMRQETVQSEQRAADSLRAAGADEAARAAQKRADAARKSMACGDWFECSLDLLGAIFWSVLESGPEKNRQSRP